MFNIFKKFNDIFNSRVDKLNEVNRFVKDFKLEVELLINNLEFKKTQGEVMPPWIMRIYPKDITVPGIDEFSSDSKTNVWYEDYWYWRGGDGGTYWGRFCKYFGALNLDQRKEYFIKYDLGSQWKERDAWFGDLFHDSPFDDFELSDEEYDKLADEVLGNA